MSTSIFLKDYAAPTYLVDSTDLDIAIHADGSIVRARLALRKNPQAGSGALRLDGEALELLSIKLDGRSLNTADYTLSEQGLSIASLPERCVLETEVRIQPDANTQLSGLYRSKNGYFTQCEAQGFRRITFYPDRPDVMARFSCTLHADKAAFPVLLANGNPVAQGDEEDGRHWARWEDPFPKPAYLFACVAAKLDMVEDYFTTRSGRRVRCAVYVEPGKLDQCDHAMAAIKLAMRWDEETFGLEMDLDHYMIVAVGDFNMGAMENKGLNIFNTKYVLARPDTATDSDYQHIDRVVAHEYFHNWTGNRVTCRDWFQLSLKEGLTVFRDQNFGMDVHSAGVTRIQEVRTLRAAQFPEDAGPMAHPIRPASYAEINNFYTATVYEKGAEVVRMIHTLIGAEAFRRGMDIYFQRHDGQAVTCEDFVAAMEAGGNIDLSQFKRWYNQAGTPRLHAQGDYDAGRQRYSLRITQSYPESAYERRLRSEGLEVARGPYHMPISVALFDRAGNAMPLQLTGEQSAGASSRVLSLTDDEQEFIFEGVASAPVPSLLRGFSAPVILDFAYSDAELSLLMAHDTDPVNRWEAGQRLATRILLAGVECLQAAPQSATTQWVPETFVAAFAAQLSSSYEDGADLAFVAEAMQLPSESYLGEQMQVVDPEAIHLARVGLRQHLAQALQAPLLAAYEHFAVRDAYVPSTGQAGRRALRNTCLGYLAELQDAAASARLQAQFDSASNMTDSMAALSCLAQFDTPARTAALEAFYQRWQGEALVVDKWLNVQATSRLPGTVHEVRRLMQHPAFDMRNPNKVYALLRAFCGANPRHFHAADGSGYALAADVIAQLDPLNPQVASRIARCFDTWRRFDGGRQRQAEAALRRIQALPKLSGDVAEVVHNALAD